MTVAELTIEDRDLSTLLRKDLRAAAESLTVPEVRYLVDLYYAVQDFRIQSGNQVAALGRSGEPHLGISYTAARMLGVEQDIQAMLDRFTRTEPSGLAAWARETVGIGPVISAGLLANIDISRCPTVGHIWSFAGLNPEARWEKGEKRPWNARLKVLCWKMGESFVKVSGHPRDIYGKVYLARKAYEQGRNERGDLAEQAKAKLERFRIGADTEARKWYEQGKLPPAHIHARAKRYAVKAFLSDYHGESHRRHFGTEPPLPYPIAHLGHVHHVEGRGWIE